MKRIGIILALALMLAVVVVPTSATNVTFHTTSLNDGMVGREVVNGTFIDIRDGLGTAGGTTDPTTDANLRADSETDKYARIWRGIIIFDTSSIPDDAVINSATIGLNCSNKYVALADSGIAITKFKINGSISNGDYSDFDNDKFTNYSNISTFTSNQYKPLALNAIGLSNISKTSSSGFGVRVQFDIDNFAPPWVAARPLSGLDYYTADTAGSGPYLEVNYTSSAPPLTITNLALASASSSKLKFNWTNPTDTDFNQTLIYLNGTRYTNTSNTTHQILLSGLTQDTTYTLSTKTEDVTGAVNDTWVNLSATTNPTGGFSYSAIGDSVTRAYPYGGDLAIDGSDCYIIQYQTTYNPTGTSYHNMDGAGTYSSWGITNFSSHYNNEDYFFFMFGMNDLKDGISAATTAANYETIYNMATSNGSIAIPIIQTTVNTSYDLSAHPWRTLANQSAFIQTIEAYLDSKGIDYVRGYDAVDSGYNNGVVDATTGIYLSDDSHPKKEGHTRISELIRAYFQNHILPVASFTASASGSTVTFTDQSTNTPISWIWQYNQHESPGVTTFSTSQNPSYDFVFGTYDINLTACNAAGCDSEVKSSYLTISATSSAVGDNSTTNYPTRCSTSALTTGLMLMALALFIGGPLIMVLTIFTNITSNYEPGKFNFIIIGFIMFIVGAAMFIITYVVLGPIATIGGC